MAETAEDQGGGAADPRLEAINDYTLKTLKVCTISLSPLQFVSATSVLNWVITMHPVIIPPIKAMAFAFK